MTTLARSAKKPEDLIRLAQEAGATVRATTGGGWMVRGPICTVNVPSKWEHGRGRQNVLASMRRAGITFEIADDSASDAAATPLDIPARRDDLPPAAPTIAVPPPQSTETELAEPDDAPRSAVQDDLEALLDMVSSLAARVDRLADRVEEVAQSAGLEPPPDPDAPIRARIAEWFQTLPPGMKVPTAVVIDNVCGPDDDAAAFRRQLARLVELGDVEYQRAAKGAAPGRYSRPAVPEVTAP